MCVYTHFILSIFFFLRCPPLTLLHLSASKFSEASTASSGGITSFFRSDVVSTKKDLSGSNPAAGVAGNSQKQPTPKRMGVIESLFQNAAKRRRQDHDLSEGAKDELDDGEEENEDDKDFFSENGASTSSNMQGAISSFFQKKEQRTCQTSATTTANGTSVVPYQVEAFFQNQTHAGAHPAISDKDTHISNGLCAIPEDSSGPQTALSFSSEDYLTCDHCGQKVLAWEMPEHSDFHFAQDLQNSFSSPSPSPSSSNQIPANLSKTSHLASGGRTLSSDSMRQAKKPKPNSTVTLDSFFKRR